MNLGQGFPDFEMSEALTDLVDKAMKDGYNQYAPMPGWLPLREAIAEKIQFLIWYDSIHQRKSPLHPVAPTLFIAALTAILNPGDEVIVMQPNYDSYVPNILVNGAKPVFVRSDIPGLQHQLGES